MMIRSSLGRAGADLVRLLGHIKLQFIQIARNICRYEAHSITMWEHSLQGIHSLDIIPMEA